MSARQYRREHAKDAITIFIPLISITPLKDKRMMFLRVQFLKLLLFYLLQLYLQAIGKCLLLFFVSWSNKILINKCLFTTTIFTSDQKVSVKVYKNVRHLKA